MTKWTLPEGRKPLTDSDYLAKRLRDGVGMAVGYWPATIHEAADRIEELEAKLAQAAVFLQFLDENYRHAFGDIARQKILELYAELKVEDRI